MTGRILICAHMSYSEPCIFRNEHLDYIESHKTNVNVTNYSAKNPVCPYSLSFHSTEYEGYNIQNIGLPVRFFPIAITKTYLGGGKRRWKKPKKCSPKRKKEGFAAQKFFQSVFFKVLEGRECRMYTTSRLEFSAVLSCTEIQEKLWLREQYKRPMNGSKIL